MRASLLISAGIFAATTAAFTYGERESTTSAMAPVVEATLLPISVAIENPIEVAPSVETADRPRIALQAGHWLAAEAPDELAGIRSNGTRGGGKMEWEVNLEIARLAAGMLEEAGYIVDVLPATVPPSYRADLFIAIHADGHNDTSISGFRAASRRDRFGRRGRELVSAPGSEAVSARGREFVEILANEYGRATNLRRIGDVTRRMENYYAFNSRRFVHSLHPETVGVILETGFLTNASDRHIIVDAPSKAAQGIVGAVQLYLAPPDPQPAAVADVP
jgi:N-acetylmuramoyl-L-alanine amidase